MSSTCDENEKKVALLLLRLQIQLTTKQLTSNYSHSALLLPNRFLAGYDNVMLLFWNHHQVMLHNKRTTPDNKVDFDYSRIFIIADSDISE